MLLTIPGLCTPSAADLEHLWIAAHRSCIDRCRAIVALRGKFPHIEIVSPDSLWGTEKDGRSLGDNQMRSFKLHVIDNISEYIYTMWEDANRQEVAAITAEVANLPPIDGMPALGDVVVSTSDLNAYEVNGFTSKKEFILTEKIAGRPSKYYSTDRIKVKNLSYYRIADLSIKNRLELIDRSRRECLMRHLAIIPFRD